MKLFKDTSKQEHQNWNKAVSAGFYILLSLLFVNIIMHSYNGAELMSSLSMFWTGIIVTFGYQFILNRRSVSKRT
jgi:putative flippase GtrA